MLIRHFLLLGIACVVILQGYAQDFNLLEEEEEVIRNTTATFKTNRVINGHSIEMVAKQELDLKISHRFGFLNSGTYELFGLDKATMRIGVDYGITDNLNVGLGRSSIEKTYDGFVKYKFLHQQNGTTKRPFSAVVMGHVGVNTLKSVPKVDLANRLHFTSQLLLARKFSKGFSLQLMPSHTHINLVDSSHFSNDIFALGIGLRQKLTTRTTLNLEYFYVLSGQLAAAHQNALSVGFDIETGGHVFQLFFTNALAPFEKGFITDTKAKWSDGDVRFGFNIARIFSF